MTLAQICEDIKNQQPRMSVYLLSLALTLMLQCCNLLTESVVSRSCVETCACSERPHLLVRCR